MRLTENLVIVLLFLCENVFNGSFQPIAFTALKLNLVSMLSRRVILDILVLFTVMHVCSDREVDFVSVAAPNVVF